jgi:hypothetical protein
MQAIILLTISVFLFYFEKPHCNNYKLLITSISNLLALKIALHPYLATYVADIGEMPHLRSVLTS